MSTKDPVHPGKILSEVLDKNGMTARSLARDLLLPAARVNAILEGSRGVSADIALRLAKHFGTEPHYWMVLQNSYDLAVAEQRIRDPI